MKIFGVKNHEKYKEVFICFCFCITGRFSNAKKVVAEGESPGGPNVLINATFDGTNTLELLVIGNQTLGSVVSVSAYEGTDYEFAFWVVNGVVDYTREARTTFIVTSTLNAQAVYHPNDKHAVLFIDSNGKLLATEYVDEGADLTPALPDTTNLTKPGYIVNATNPWKSLVGSDDVSSITANTVFQLQYALDVVNTIIITVNDVEQEPVVYNSLFTVTADEGYHWVGVSIV